MKKKPYVTEEGFEIESGIIMIEYLMIHDNVEMISNVNFHV